MNTLNKPEIDTSGFIKETKSELNIPQISIRGNISSFVQTYLYETYKYVALGLGITLISAIIAFRTGLPLKLMAMNPIVSSLGFTAALMGSMVAVRSISPENKFAKNLSFTIFNGIMGASLCGLAFLHPTILLRAGIYTAGLVSALSFTAMTAKQDQFLFLGGPLLAGLSVIFLSTLVGMFLPARFAVTLSVIDKLWMYGGLAIFSGLMLFDTQRLMNNARNRENLSLMAQNRLSKPDYINESISIYLNVINIFVRLAMMLANSNSNNKRR